MRARAKEIQRGQNARNLVEPRGHDHPQGALGADLWFGEFRLGPWLLHPITLMFAISGSLMISKTLRIPKP